MIRTQNVLNHIMKFHCNTLYEPLGTLKRLFQGVNNLLLLIVFVCHNPGLKTLNFSPA